LIQFIVEEVQQLWPIGMMMKNATPI